jgi:hypothetical protein
VELKVYMFNLKENDEYFETDKGYRFDDINHNWVFVNEFISLSYSYMTLVMN